MCFGGAMSSTFRQSALETTHSSVAGCFARWQSTALKSQKSIISRLSASPVANYHTHEKELICSERTYLQSRDKD